MPATHQFPAVRYQRSALPLAFSLLVLLVVSGIGCNATPTSEPQTPTQPPAASSASQPTPPQPPLPTLPGIDIDLEAGYIELQATVIGHGCEWLELVACTAGSREHESLVTVIAKPSDLHLALLLLGVEPGSPQSGVRGEDGWQIIPPNGGVVDLHFVLPADPAQPDQPPQAVPVESWVFDRAANQPLADDPEGWIFTGSRMVRDHREPDAPAVYLADANGTVASLVHFGDETLGRATHLSEATDGQNLAPLEQAMPPNGTPVRLRISRPAPPRHPETADPKP